VRCGQSVDTCIQENKERNLWIWMRNSIPTASLVAVVYSTCNVAYEYLAPMSEFALSSLADKHGPISATVAFVGDLGKLVLFMK